MGPSGFRLIANITRQTSGRVAGRLLLSLLCFFTNVVAPHAITQRTLTTTLARRLGIRVRGRVPAPLLRCVLGELSSALIDDQNIFPQRALATGFHFTAPAWRSCLDAMLGDELSARPSLVH